MAAGASAAAGVARDDAACARAALACADAAYAATPSAEVDLALAGRRLRLRIAGERLATALLAPLDRVTAAPSGTPDAVITAFHGAESAERPPVPAGEPGRRHGDDDLHLAYEAVSPLLSVLDGETGRGAVWMGDVATLAQWHHTVPLRDLVRWTLRRHGLQLVHAAAVGDDRGVILIAGAGGSGKSSTAMACALRGLRHLADDYVLVAPGAPPLAHPVFGQAKLDERALRRLGLPGAAPAGAPADWKATVAPVGGVTEAMPARAILLPRVAERTGTPQRVGPAQALAALAPSTLIQLAGSGPADLAALGALARALPAYRLEVGADADAIAARVDEVLAA
jgi:hypothetical protein